MERLTKNGLVVLLLAPWLAVVDCTVMCYRPKVPVPLIDARNASDSLPRRRVLSERPGECPRGVTDLFYVHIGKAAGTSVRAFLLENRVSFNELHIMAIARPMIERGARWLFVVRDPIARAASAFYWRQPQGERRQLKRAHHVRPRRPMIQDVDEIALYHCFSNFSAFGEALDAETSCGALARQILADPPESCHLGMGLAYYLRDPHALATRDVFLIRTETLQRDANAFGAWYDENRSSFRPKVQRENYGHAYSKTLSPKARSNLRAALADDYACLALLERIAANGSGSRLNIGRRP